MVFTIQITYARALYPMTVALIKSDKDFEYFKVFNPKTPEHYIIIRSNRPMLKLRGLKKKPLDWRLIEGQVKNRSNYELTLAAIEAHLNPTVDKRRPR